MDNVKEIEALKILFSRYNDIIHKNEEVLSTNDLPEKCRYKHLLRLTEEAIKNIETYPGDKMHRWLGFTQGILSAKGLIDVDEERDFSRPLLHSFHKDKPKTFE